MTLQNTRSLCTTIQQQTVLKKLKTYGTLKNSRSITSYPVQLDLVRSEVLTVELLKIRVLRDVISCDQVNDS